MKRGNLEGIGKYRMLILRYRNCSAANINGPKFIFSREYEKYNNDSIIRIHYSKHNEKLQKQSNYNSTLQQANLYKS